ncbi:MAG: VOC family protein [Mariniblastus sp.]
MTDHKPALVESALFGAVHLNNTSIERATRFWVNIVGLTCRSKSDKVAEFGTAKKTLVVVHQTAKQPFQKGYSGLYHFAIHAPNEREFARMVYRLLANRYPCSPTDHTMSKSIYLTDPDGITVEFTLETPERFKRVITTGGLKMEGVDGIVRGPSEKLDVDAVLQALPDRDLRRGISSEANIGHFHLYANNVEKSNSFYRAMGFEQFNYLPQFKYADVGAGGAYRHRIAMNSWHGTNRPLAPQGSAGLLYFQVDYTSGEGLRSAIKNFTGYASDERGHWLIDPTGNRILLASV